MTAAVHGLYAITAGGDTDRLVADAEQALRGGATILQYRDKSGDAARREAQGATLRQLCRDYDTLFLINDDIPLARRVAADGVHLGSGDTALADARQSLGTGAVIGISCYNQLSRAIEAQSAGADYVAFGRFFPSRTKPNAVQAEVALLSEARRRLSVPIVAIGGITPANGAALIEAGADALAVIDGLFGQADIAAAARAYRQLFTV